MQLAKAIGKSRRCVGKHINELKGNGIYAVQSGSNQYARACFEIGDKHWPYKTQEALDV